MSLGAICFTSCSNGGCWVVLVSPPLFWKKVFFPYATFAKKKVYVTYA